MGRKRRSRRKRRTEVQTGLREGWICRRGDIYYANLNPFKGSEQGGTRPVLVLSNDIGNRESSVLIVAPITTELKKPDLPTHVFLEKGKGLRAPSMVCLEQLTLIDRLRILSYVGKLDREQMKRVDAAALVSIGITLPPARDSGSAESRVPIIPVKDAGGQISGG